MADNEAEQLSRRNRLMRQAAAQMTPEQRMERARQMHEWSLRQLANNPQAWDRFLRRNLRQRAVNPHEYP